MLLQGHGQKRDTSPLDLTTTTTIIIRIITITPTPSLNLLPRLMAPTSIGAPPGSRVVPFLPLTYHTHGCTYEQQINRVAKPKVGTEGR